MKYIIATDYDGTLYQYHKGGISKEVTDAIAEFRKRGNYFGVVTGRCYKWAYPIFKKEGLFEFDYIISNGGAQVCDSEGKLIISDKISANGFAAKLVNRLFSLGTEEVGLALETTRYNFSPEFPEGNDVYSSFIVTETINEMASAHGVAKNEEDAIMMESILLDEFGEVISIARNHRCLDITALGVSKASGIQRYADLMGVDKDNIYAIGDNYNDMPMVKAFNGCSVANGVDELKNAAQYICEDIAELVKIIFSKEEKNGKVSL